MKKGFTLVEVALVLVIAGIVFGSLSAALAIYIKNQQVSATRERLDAIDGALQLFLSLNGRYPCPAKLNSPPDTADFGVEVSALAGGATGDCGAATPTAPLETTSVSGFAGRPGNVRIGAVPVRTLNLPDTFIADAWGQRFTFAMTEFLATDTTYDRDGGAIDVVDSALPVGNTLIFPQGSAHYVVVSHGRDGAGGTTLQGGGALPCNLAPATLDSENCNGDATFRSTLLLGAGTAASFYDDFVRMKSVSPFGEQVPPGAVMAFDLSACPIGWISYGLAAGRTIIGAGSYVATNPGEADVTYVRGDDGGISTIAGSPDEVGLNVSPVTVNPAAIPGGERFITTGPSARQENRPPYLALLYCEKT